VRFLEPALLLILHHGPAHGYTMIDQLADYGLVDTDPSALYRHLRDMEGRGWVESAWEAEGTRGPPRRIYHLTRQGADVLAWWTQDLAETAQIIDRLLAAYARRSDESPRQGIEGPQP
jgi:DNA-binding PadR family transcriptional regulator